MAADLGRLKTTALKETDPHQAQPSETESPRFTPLNFQGQKLSKQLLEIPAWNTAPMLAGGSIETCRAN